MAHDVTNKPLWVRNPRCLLQSQQVAKKKFPHIGPQVLRKYTLGILKKGTGYKQHFLCFIRGQRSTFRHLYGMLIDFKTVAAMVKGISSLSEDFAAMGVSQYDHYSAEAGGSMTVTPSQERREAELYEAGVEKGRTVDGAGGTHHYLPAALMNQMAVE
eukprot:5799784-Amphidinium_carterae.1